MSPTTRVSIFEFDIKRVVPLCSSVINPTRRPVRVNGLYSLYVIFKNNRNTLQISVNAGEPR